MCNKPPCSPIPLLIIYRLVISCNIQYNKVNIVILLKIIEMSRLKVTALESNINIIDNTIMFSQKRRLNSHF